MGNESLIQLSRACVKSLDLASGEMFAKGESSPWRRNMGRTWNQQVETVFITKQEEPGGN